MSLHGWIQFQWWWLDKQHSLFYICLYWACGRSTLAVALGRLGELLFFSIFLFCLAAACTMFGIHLQLSFTVCLVNSLCKEFEGGRRLQILNTFTKLHYNVSQPLFLQLSMSILSYFCLMGYTNRIKTKTLKLRYLRVCFRKFVDTFVFWPTSK